MKKITNISERIKEIIDTLGISRNEFATKLGYNRSQNIYDIVNGKSKPSFDFFEKFLNSEYSETISIKWLITGNDEMNLIKKECNNDDKPISDQLIEIQKELIAYKDKEINELKKEIARLKKSQTTKDHIKYIVNEPIEQLKTEEQKD